MSLTLEDVFIPTTHSIEEAKRVMRQTEEIQDGRRELTPVVDARASAAGMKPPTAWELFFGCLAEKMGGGDDGLTKQEALRELAAEKPDLLKAFVAEENKGRQLAERRKRETAARIRNRNR